MRTALALAAAAVLAVGAVLLALLAGDVRAWPSALHRGDAAYAAAPERADWSPRQRLGGTAEALLGTADDVRIRTALRQYRLAAALTLRLDNATTVETARARAQDSLTVASRGSGPRASQALTLLGILAYRLGAAGSLSSQAGATEAAFTDAVRIDPRNADAAFDLELLLRLARPAGARVQHGQSSLGRTGRRGAGGGEPGQGY